MSWTLSASGHVPYKAGDREQDAEEVERELAGKLREVFGKSNYGMVNAVFNGTHVSRQFVPGEADDVEGSDVQQAAPVSGQASPAGPGQMQQAQAPQPQAGGQPAAQPQTQVYDPASQQAAQQAAGQQQTTAEPQAAYPPGQTAPGTVAQPAGDEEYQAPSTPASHTVDGEPGLGTDVSN